MVNGETIDCSAWFCAVGFRAITGWSMLAAGTVKCTGADAAGSTAGPGPAGPGGKALSGTGAGLDEACVAPAEDASGDGVGVPVVSCASGG